MTMRGFARLSRLVPMIEGCTYNAHCTIEATFIKLVISYLPIPRVRSRDSHSRGQYRRLPLRSIAATISFARS